MMIVRRFYTQRSFEQSEQVSPELATHSAEMALDDNGEIINGTFKMTERKRRKEVFGSLPSGTIYRASSEQEVKDFNAHWSKDRV